MREVIISEREEGQRLDRYLEKYMPDAPKSFFYKMMAQEKHCVKREKSVWVGADSDWRSDKIVSCG